MSLHVNDEQDGGTMKGQSASYGELEDSLADLDALVDGIGAASEVPETTEVKVHIHDLFESH